MPRYIDADKLRPQDLSNEQVDCITVNGIAVLGRSHSKNIKTFAEMLNQIIDKAPTEDVVPRSEVEELKKIYRTYNKAIKHERQEIAKQIFEEIEADLNNLIRYYKEKRKYVTEVDYNEFEQRFCDIKIKTFEERLLKVTELKKKYIGE